MPAASAALSDRHWACICVHPAGAIREYGATVEQNQILLLLLCCNNACKTPSSKDITGHQSLYVSAWLLLADDQQT